MIEYRDKDKVVPGMHIRATGFRVSEHHITAGRGYRVVSVQEGIFACRPYVQVINDRGEPSGLWHLSRFSFMEEAQ